ncbi:conjugal transfer entry exclusion protein TraS [Klebsiella electrica]|uniref:conjugal transfer entry exclusion protein TraS n=1 Tax=Klebsiella electrica TaxID=1259973 RepID=UPI001D18549E|nr:conjugal transfer entry exclusion protein TraS [Klebsiella electrica]
MKNYREWAWTMITNKQILQEVEQLKELFNDGGAEIPPMWQCFWPGLAAMAWMVTWPLILYGYKFLFLELPDAANIGVAASVIIAMVAGLFIMIGIANTRALYLSIPKRFRDNSALCRLLVNKARRYSSTYLVGYAVLIVLFTFPVHGAIYSTVIFILSSFGFMIYMNVDLNRYQLTALTSLLESFKSSGAK